jgi:hypothetical protein
VTRPSKDQLNDPNFGLATESLVELNNDFYRLEPWVYFRFRLRNLALSAGRELELQNLLGEGVSVDGFKLGAENFSPKLALDDEERSAQQSFVVLEAEVLLHHVAETLLRLYIAHESDPECPWIAITSERDFGRFKGKVSDLRQNLETPDYRDRAAKVFFGASDWKELRPAINEDEWTHHLENSIQWLSWFAAYMLDGYVYNAAKHGLGVWPQNSALSVEIDGMPDFLNGSGPCLEYLHTSREADGRIKWRRTTKWVRIDKTFASIHIACALIHRLWSVGSVRHGNFQKADLELFPFPSPSELLANDEMALTNFSRSLRYYEDPTAEP